MKIILCLSFTIFCFNLVESDGEYNALIFDPGTRSLIEVPDELPKNGNCGDWVTACPAKENTDDDNFNKKKSYFKNALFVRAVYTPKVQLNDLWVKVCDQPFKLSIVVFEENADWHFEFGYEIYFDKSWNGLNFEISDKRKYRSLKDVLKLTNPFHLAKRLAVIPFEAISNGIKTARGKEMPKKQDKDKGFTWIPLFKVKFWPRELRRIEYDIRENNKQPMMDCKDYSLGKEMLNNIDVNEFYSKKVQEKAFNKLTLPEKANSACKKSKECLEKWLLIPADQFQFGSSMSASCSIMTVIPIWSNIKDVLKKVDEYLYMLSEVSYTPFRIIAGVDRHFKLPGSWGMKNAVTLKTKGFTLYVPRIIYKIVAFKIAYGCEENTNCWYAAMIVIHNDPDFNGKPEICMEDKSVDWGWEDIKPSPIKGTSKYIYICPVSTATLNSVGLGLYYKELLSTRELSLINFPFASFGKPIKTYNVKKGMLKKMNPSSVTETGSKKSAKQGVITRPLIDRNEFKQPELKDKKCENDTKKKCK